MRTVKPFGRFVTLYSGALSRVSMALSFYTTISVSHRVCTYLVVQWLEWIEFGHAISVGVGVNSVEDSVQNSWVRSESGSLLQKTGKERKRMDLQPG